MSRVFLSLSYLIYCRSKSINQKRILKIQNLEPGTFSPRTFQYDRGPTGPIINGFIQA